MNRYLPEDICVTEVRVASDPFPQPLQCDGENVLLHLLCRGFKAGI